MKQRQFGEAFQHFGQALRARPELAEAHCGRATTALLLGDFERGWPESEWRTRVTTLTPGPSPATGEGRRGGTGQTFAKSLWQGEPLEGRTVLLSAGRSLRDAFQFIRYARLVQERDGRVIVRCPRSLIPILKTCSAAEEFWADDEPPPEFDVQIPMASLSRVFGTRLATIPAHVPYLAADPAMVDLWKGQLAATEGFKVGIGWQDNAPCLGTSHGSIPLAHFAPLAAIPGVKLVSLQKGPGQEQAAEARFSIVDFGSKLDEVRGAFMDTAAILKSLDLVITADTALAHLGGALGVPVWVLLPYVPDWRWLLDREDSPWYPTMRLFRQPRSDDWHEVLASVAESLMEKAAGRAPEQLAAEPATAERLNSKGVDFAGRHRLEEAIGCFRQAIGLKSRYAEAHSNLGNALRTQRRTKEAIAALEKSLAIKPDYAEAHHNLALALLQAGKPDEAIASFKRAIELRSPYPEAHSNLGIALTKAGKTDEAIENYHRAVELKPDYADAHMNQALTYLAIGDFPHGWTEYEWRWQCKDFNPRRFPQPRWKGEPLAGRRIVLCSEQGFGDSFQFVRYARLVKERGGEVLVRCPKPLMPLLRRCAGVDRVCAEGEPPPPFDTFIELLSLPLIFGTRVETIPRATPYIFPDPELVEYWRNDLGCIRAMKVGIHWQGSTKYRGDRLRSIPLGHFAPLAGIQGVRLVSLQRGYGTEQIEHIRFPLMVLGGQVDEARGAFMDTAAILKNLDLVVTSDTSLAHLAGGLGVPVWVPLPDAPDWRWMLNGER